MYKYLILISFLLLSCMSETVDTKDKYRPTEGKADQIQLQQVLFGWEPVGYYVGVETQGMDCWWSSDGSDGDDLDGGFTVFNLDTHRPFMWHNNDIMACTPLLEYSDAWHLQCKQKVIVDFIGLYWVYGDFFVFKEFNAAGQKGWLHWTFYGIDLDFWCTYSIIIMDEGPTYGWR